MNILFIIMLLAVLAAAEVVVYKPKFRLGGELLPACKRRWARKATRRWTNAPARWSFQETPKPSLVRAACWNNWIKSRVRLSSPCAKTDINTLTNLGLDIRWSVVGGGWRLGAVRDDQTLDGERWEVRAGKAVRVYRSQAASDQTVRFWKDLRHPAFRRKREFSPDNVFWSRFTGSGCMARTRSAHPIARHPAHHRDAVQLDIEPQATFFTGTQRETRTVAEARTTVRVPIGGSILLAASSTARFVGVLGNFPGLCRRRHAAGYGPALPVAPGAGGRLTALRG
jgi:hypothetical protein